MKRRQPWDMQPNESAKAFDAFAIYRDMGPDRSVKAVSGIVGKVYSQVGAWSARHNWVERAKAYDAEIGRIAADREKDKRVEARIRIASQARAVAAMGLRRLAGDPERNVPPADMDARTAVAAWQAGVKTEAAILDIGQRVEVTGADGAPIQVQDVPFDWARALGSRPNADEGMHPEDE